MSDARALTLALRGKWYRRYGLACCPAHGDRRPSLTLADAPDGRLFLHCKTGCDFRDVLAALRDRGLLDRHARPQPPEPSEIARRRVEEEAEAVKRERHALAIWREAVPVHDTIAETYLRGRGITCPLPNSLRFHPACWHGATAQRLPALVARVDGLPRLAVHRTYLRADGSGKAEVKGFDIADKAVVGDVAGAAEALRWAMMSGEPQVVLADALAEAVHTIARVGPACVRGGFARFTARARSRRVGLAPASIASAR